MELTVEELGLGAIGDAWLCKGCCFSGSLADGSDLGGGSALGSSASLSSCN